MRQVLVPRGAAGLARAPLSMLRGMSSRSLSRPNERSLTLLKSALRAVQAQKPQVQGADRGLSRRQSLAKEIEAINGCFHCLRSHRRRRASCCRATARCWPGRDRDCARSCQRHSPGERWCPSSHARPAARRYLAVGTSPQGRPERAVRGRCALRSAARAIESGRSWGRSLAVAAAREVGADRFVQVSAIGADSGPPPGFDDAWWASYYAAKHAADEALRTGGLRWTVIRPGALSDAAPTRHVSLSESLPLREIPRADVASLGSQSSATRPALGTPGMQLPGPSRFVTPSGRPSCPSRAPNQTSRRVLSARPRRLFAGLSVL